ncbi:hypothetical protein N7495_002016 [Penicillium taxi]|uniref:uncharacterized protein n=1 Tax=Penicillium taxi TaxID=168475 RepID=UPI002544F0C5|nr:uncharacterized protein N7495_002016 [Penicillium taxi]KAJ5901488.1 hypothetical protein N7495_002016 [Penicillium taxi]
MSYEDSSMDTSSDSGSFCSTNPTTPSSSPLFRPSEIEDLKLAQLPQSTAAIESDPTIVKNLCVVGAGYVGGPTAAVLALYHPSLTVEVLDRDSSRIKRWQSPHLPVHEPELNNVVRVARDGAHASQVAIQGPRDQNLFFTCDSNAISRADIIFMAVNTPTKTFGVGAGCATNMTAFDGAMLDVAKLAKPGAIIVEKSTVPGGTAERVRKTLATYRPGVPFEVLSNPEFLAEGSAIQNLTVPDRVLIGCAPTPQGYRAADALANLYRAWVPASRILTTNTWSSELSKLVANAMLAQRISSINSISAICERTGAEVDEVAKAIGMDMRIGNQFLKAGLGFGGSCFRKDIASLAYLAEYLGLDDVAHYWRQVNVINEHQRDRFARKVIDRFEGNLVGRKLAVLGFAFKKNTGDTRESLAVGVIQSMLEERPAEIAIFDPYCHEDDILRELGLESALGGTVKVYKDPYQACSEAHAVLVVSDCDQFRNTPGTVSTFETIALPCPASSACVRPEQEMWTHSGVSYELSPQNCAEDCSDCRMVLTRSIATDAMEWSRIASKLCEPKWVFDGRNILNCEKLANLGVRVDTVGRRS